MEHQIHHRLRLKGRHYLERGFTLLELLVVLILIAIMLGLSIPAFRTSLFTDQLRQAARSVIGTIHEVRQSATGSTNGCFIDIDLSENQLSYRCLQTPGEGEEMQLPEDRPSPKVELPPAIRISSLWSGTDKQVTSGNASFWVNRNGRMEQLIINLTDGEKELALICSVFSALVRLEDKAMSPADLEQN